MTDRELLEAAAKAAGVEGHFCAKKELDTERWGIVTFLGYGQAAFWNPLTNDGDALRLAVKLGMELLPQEPLGILCVIRGSSQARAKEPYGDDRDAATRRAIVRAAASMGAKA